MHKRKYIIGIAACANVANSVSSIHLVLGVEDHSLRVGDPADVVLGLRRRQPHSRWQLVVEQGKFGDEALCFLLLCRQCGQTLSDAEQ